MLQGKQAVGAGRKTNIIIKNSVAAFIQLQVTADQNPVVAVAEQPRLLFSVF